MFLLRESHYHILSHQISNDEASDCIVLPLSQVCVHKKNK